MTTKTRTLEPGKWRIPFAPGENKSQGGYRVAAVRIKGLRHRLHPLTEIDKADFHSRLMKRPNGEVSDAAILRGLPSVYSVEGPFICLWPSPAHTWILEYDVEPKVKVEAIV